MPASHESAVGARWTDDELSKAVQRMREQAQEAVRMTTLRRESLANLAEEAEERRELNREDREAARNQDGSL